MESVLLLDPGYARKQRERVADGLAIAGRADRGKFTDVEVRELRHGRGTHLDDLLCGPAEGSWIKSRSGEAIVGSDRHVGAKVEEQTGSSSVSFFKCEGVASLSVRQLSFLRWPGKSICTADLYPFPVSVVETETSVGSKVRRVGTECRSR